MTTALVVDASAVVDGLVGEGRLPDATLHAPSLIDYEVASALRSLVRRGALAAHLAREALDLFGSLDIERHPARRLLSRMWALRDDASAYDASYIALAELLGMPLLTRDRRLARTAARWCELAP